LAAETCFRQAAANAILMHLGAIFAGKKKKMKGRIAFPFPNRQRFHNSCLVSDLPTGSKKKHRACSADPAPAGWAHASVTGRPAAVELQYIQALNIGAIPY
jgi:hypothetical protein